MRKAFLAAIVAVAGLAPLASAQAAVSAKGAPPRLGIVFDMVNPLQGIESYQGGFGAKLSFGPSAVRVLLETSYDSASAALALNFGAVYEYHFLAGPVSPYIGASLAGGYLQQGSVSSVVPLSVEAIAGAEIFILDFLSVFAEYSLSFSYTSITDLQLATTSSNFSITTGLGNGAMIGLIVYLPPAGKHF